MELARNYWKIVAQSFYFVEFHSNSLKFEKNCQIKSDKEKQFKFHWNFSIDIIMSNSKSSTHLKEAKFKNPFQSFKLSNLEVKQVNGNLIIKQSRNNWIWLIHYAAIMQLLQPIWKYYLVTQIFKCKYDRKNFEKNRLWRKKRKCVIYKTQRKWRKA